MAVVCFLLTVGLFGCGPNTEGILSDKDNLTLVAGDSECEIFIDLNSIEKHQKVGSDTVVMFTEVYKYKKAADRYMVGSVRMSNVLKKASIVRVNCLLRFERVTSTAIA